jgi:hypothetical protein
LKRKRKKKKEEQKINRTARYPIRLFASPIKSMKTSKQKPIRGEEGKKVESVSVNRKSNRVRQEIEKISEIFIFNGNRRSKKQTANSTFFLEMVFGLFCPIILVCLFCLFCFF